MYEVKAFAKLSEPIRRVSYSGFEQVPELVHILLLVPKNEATIKFYDPDSGDEVDSIIHRCFWGFIHPSINTNQVNAVRVTKNYYVVKYLLSVDDNLSIMSKYISFLAFGEAEKYNLEYTYE